MGEPARNPIVSVIMGTFNEYDEAMLHRAVVSIMTQSFRDIEFIICDDGSDKQAYEILKRVADAPFIKVIRENGHHGIAHALNRCIDEAKGSYIARMDADDVSLNDRIRIQYEYLRDNPDIAFCGCGAYLTDGCGSRWGKRMLSYSPDINDYMRFSPYIHPTVMFRSEVLREARYSEETLTLQCEDYDLFLRLFLQGKKGVNLEEYLYEYREDEDSYRRRNAVRRIREARVRYRYFKDFDVSFFRKLAAVSRPVIGGMVPKAVLGRVIRKRDGDYE